MIEATYLLIAFYLLTSNASLLVYYTHAHTQLCYSHSSFRGSEVFVAVGVSDESHWQITAFQTAFKLLPFQSGGALITDNSFHFNKEFWRTHPSFCLFASRYSSGTACACLRLV